MLLRFRSPFPQSITPPSGLRRVLFCVWVAWLIFTLPIAPAAAPAARPVDMQDPSKPTNPGRKSLREGTELVEEPGHFRTAGDRVAFFTADGLGRYLVLENLNLQRIAQVLADNPTPPQWRVSGFVTEFRGSNYLYVRSAVLGVGTDVHEQNVR